MRSIYSDVSRLLMVAAIAAGVAACTDYAGPIPGSEQPSLQPGNGGSGNGNGGSGNETGSPSGGTDSDPPNNTGGMPAGGGDLVSFNEDIHPILVEMCGECHAEPAGGLPGHGAEDPDEAFEAVTSTAGDEPVYQRILKRAAGEDGYMPPGYAGCDGPIGTDGCLSQAEYDLIALWVQQGAMNR